MIFFYSGNALGKVLVDMVSFEVIPSSNVYLVQRICHSYNMSWNPFFNTVLRNASVFFRMTVGIGIIVVMMKLRELGSDSNIINAFHCKSLVQYF